MVSSDRYGAEKVKLLEKAFKQYDKDGNGVLDKEELWGFLQIQYKDMGFMNKPARSEYDDLFDEIDEDGSGEVNFEEFKDYMLDHMKNKVIGPLEDYLKSKSVKL